MTREEKLELIDMLIESCDEQLRVNNIDSIESGLWNFAKEFIEEYAIFNKNLRTIEQKIIDMCYESALSKRPTLQATQQALEYDAKQIQAMQGRHRQEALDFKLLIVIAAMLSLLDANLAKGFSRHFDNFKRLSNEGKEKIKAFQNAAIERLQ